MTARSGSRTGAGSRTGVVVLCGLLVVLLLLALPVTLVRALSGLGLPVDTVTPGVQLVGLRPVAGVLVVLAVPVVLGLAALRARLPRAARTVGAALLAVAVLAHAGWALGPLVGGGRAGEGSTGVELRVLAVNARFGNADPQAVVGLVAEHRVDVLALTELTPELGRGLREAGLADLLPHAVATELPQAYGSGTFSRWPLEELDTPATTFTTVRTRVLVPGTEGVAVTNVHTWPPLPGTVDRWRRDHALLREAVAGDPAPRVVAGDLNATRDHTPYRQLLADAGLRQVGDPALWDPTWPSDRPWPPLLRLDHVLVDTDVSVPGARRDLPVPGSDHLAVLASVEVGPAPPP